MKHKKPPPFDPNAHRDRVEREFLRLRGRVQIADDQLLLILDAKLRPFGTGRRYFIRKVAGAYVS